MREERQLHVHTFRNGEVGIFDQKHNALMLDGISIKLEDAERFVLSWNKLAAYTVDELRAKYPQPVAPNDLALLEANIHNIAKRYMTKRQQGYFMGELRKLFYGST